MSKILLQECKDLILTMLKQVEPNEDYEDLNVDARQMYENLSTLLKKVQRIKSTSKENNLPYMISVSGGNAPRMTHANIEAADIEAKRLAEKNPKQIVSVFRLEKQYTAKLVVEEIPIKDEEDRN